MKLTITEVKKVARLSNLKLTIDQEEKFSQQLSKILEYVEELNSVDTSDIKPTFNITQKKNVLRRDEVEGSLTDSEALMNAPVKKDGFFVTNGVFDN